MSDKAAVRIVEGHLVVPEGARIAIVASRFNHFIVDRLVEGALDAIARHGGEKADVTLVRVPGSWEIPPVVARLAKVVEYTLDQEEVGAKLCARARGGEAIFVEDRDLRTHRVSSSAAGRSTCSPYPASSTCPRPS